MANDELVERIVKEVLKRIPSMGKRKSILAVLFGGTIGLKAAIDELKKIMEAGYDIQVVYSPAAEKVIGFDLLKSELCSLTMFTEESGKFPGALIKSADMVIVPVLTLNSAAKIANGIADNLASTLVMYGLLSGKPVVAVRDACCPDNKLRAKLGLNLENQRYRQLFVDNLKRIKEYGITLVDAGELSAAVLGGGMSKKASGRVEEKPGVSFKRRVLSAGDITSCKETVIRISGGTIVTSLARDLARDRGIEIVKG